MASATTLPIKSIAFTTILVLATAALHVNIRNLLISTFTGPGRKSRIFAALIILANLKNVPGVWHFRVLGSIFKHFFLSKPNLSPHLGSSALFAPVITSSRSPLWECDYNLHKSNSTYFSDLDVTRSHLVGALLQPGIRRLHFNQTERLVLDKDGSPNKGRFRIMLGSVMCSFKREIGIYEPFEMWTRLLCWDRKWVYLVSHLVKKGTVKPSAYILTDGSWFTKGYKKVEGHVGSQEIDEKAIFATSISKYVVKLGRLTIHPEVMLEASGLLPERPRGWAKMQGDSGESTPEILETIPAEEAASSATNGDPWDWKWVETEKENGLQLATHFAALDDLHHEFSGSRAPALGKYRDFLT